MAVAWFCRGICFHIAAESFSNSKSNAKITNARAIISSKDKESQRFLQSAILDYSKALELLFTHTYNSNSILESSKSSEGGNMMLPIDGIDYKQLGLNFILTKVQILFNRALAFSSFGLFHRARDDLILAKSVIAKKENTNSNSMNEGGVTKEIDRLLMSVTDSLKSMPVSMLTYSPNDKISTTQISPVINTSFPAHVPSSVATVSIPQSTTQPVTTANGNTGDDQDLETDIDTFVYKLKNRPTVEELVRRNIMPQNLQQKH